MIDVAIIASCIPERRPLLARSLETWRTSIEASGLHGVIGVWGEGGPEENENWSAFIHHNRLGSEPFDFAIPMVQTGTHITGYNHFLSLITPREIAKVVLFTHPEIMFPKDTVRVAYEQAQDNVFVAFKMFWLSPDMTRDLENFNWRQPETLEQEPMLFELDELLKGSFYGNANTRAMKQCDSTTTWAMNLQTIKRMKPPFPNLGHQGYDDPYFCALRSYLGIRNFTVQEPCLFHQFHRNTWTGTGEEAVAEAQTLLDEFRRKE